MKQVLIADGLSTSRFRCIAGRERWEIDVHSKMTADELRAAIETVDALIVRSASRVTSDVLQNASQLKIIGRAGTV